MPIMYNARNTQVFVSQKAQMQRWLIYSRRLIVCILVQALLTNAVSCKVVAITFDDLPGVGLGSVSFGHSKFATYMHINQRILNSLISFNAPATGFINDISLASYSVDKKKQFYDLWMQNGYTLGNHTYSHLRLSRVTTKQFEDDINRGFAFYRQYIKELCYTTNMAETSSTKIPNATTQNEKDKVFDNKSTIINIPAKKSMESCAGISQNTRSKIDYNEVYYFRYPYLDLGRNKIQRRHIEDFLSDNNYVIAHVTIAPDDWKYNKMLLNNPKAKEKIIAQYLRFVKNSFQNAEYSAKKFRTNNKVKHILLLHLNLLHYYAIDDLLKMIKEMGYQFIPLKEALYDKLHKSMVHQPSSNIGK